MSDEDGDITRSMQLPFVLVGKSICCVRENSLIKLFKDDAAR